MEAIRVHRPGGPEVLEIEEIARPESRAGWVRIRVRAFGLNRSEMFTRQGHSPSVRFPRVLGIECVGEVDDAGGTDLDVGQTVAALMGEMGRAYDGGYAEYTLVPRERVRPIRTSLPWDVLAALPETWLTAWGSLVEGDGDPGRSNARDPRRDVRRVPGGVDGLLELIGPVTLLDSLRAVRRRGVVCHTGLLGNVWIMERFEPLEDIPSTVRLTTYESSTTSADGSTAVLQEIADGVAAGRYRANIERRFRFDEIVAAHRFMEENRGSGKLVVVVDA
jgi:NADPH:quinone reductase-like Zn-dependent oxidoreductase